MSAFLFGSSLVPVVAAVGWAKFWFEASDPTHATSHDQRHQKPDMIFQEILIRF